jgi:hypothetical protein
MPELVVRLRVAGDKDVKQAMDALGVQAEALGIKIVGTVDAHRRLTQEARSALRAMGDFSQTLSGVSGLLSIVAKDNTALRDSLEKVTVAMAIGSTALGVFRNAAEFAAKRTELLAAAIERLQFAPLVIALFALGAGIADVNRRLQEGEPLWKALAAQISGVDEAVQALTPSLGRVSASTKEMVEQARSAAFWYAQFTDEMERFTKLAPAFEGQIRGITLSTRGLLGPDRPKLGDVEMELRKTEEFISGIEEDRARKDAAAAARNAEAMEREGQQRREAERRRGQELVQLRAEALRAMLELQGQSFEAQVVQLDAAYQRERGEHQGQKQALLAIEARYWADYQSMAKRTLQSVAQQARSAAQQIRDIDMAILGVRKEFFGITPEQQIAALEAMKRTLDPAKDADRIAQINRELLGIYKDQSESLQQQAADLRTRAAEEGLAVVQRTAMLAKARELEETAARLRRELPAKSKELGQEIITALLTQRSALLQQFNDLRKEFTSITTASGTSVKAIGDQFTALGQHMVVTMAAAAHSVSDILRSIGSGKPISITLPKFVLPGGGTVPFPGNPPIDSPTLAAPVPEQPLSITGPIRVTSAVTREQLATQAGGADLLRVLKQFEAEGRMGITVNINGSTFTLTTDEEALFRRMLERFASTDRRTPQ